MRTKTIDYGFLILSLSLLTACLPFGKTIGGSITGLTSAGLVLQNNAADDLAVTAGSDKFIFAKSIAKGANYAVTVLTQPQSQTCTVSNGSGTVADVNISNVSINCVDNAPPSFLYMTTPATSSDGTVFTIDPSTGALGQGTTMSLGTGAPILLGSDFSFPSGSGAPIIGLPSSGKFAYVLDIMTDASLPGAYFTYSAYTIDAGTGVLAKVPGGPMSACLWGSFMGQEEWNIDISLPGTGRCVSFFNKVVFHPSGKFAYVVDTPILGFAINADNGSWTPVPGDSISPDLCSSSPFFDVRLYDDTFTIHPSGKFAYAFNSTGGSMPPGCPSYPGRTLSVYSIDVNTGTMGVMPGGPSVIGTMPINFVIHPSGKFAYVFDLGTYDATTSSYPAAGQGLFVHAIDTSTGAVAASGIRLAGWKNRDVNTLAQVSTLNFDPSGKFAYVYHSAAYFGSAIQSSDTISAYAVNFDNGVLSEIPGSPFDVGISTNQPIDQNPAQFLFTPSGKIVYVKTNDGTGEGMSNTTSGGTLLTYGIDGHTGALVKKSSIQANGALISIR
jgi:hypothetical protein